MKWIDPALEQYAVDHSTLPSKVCDSLEVHTHQVEPMARMLIGKMEASFLGFLIRSMAVTRILEIGTFTGYSALAMAENLPEAGEIHTIDIEKREYTDQYWSASPQGGKIRRHLGPALEVIPCLPGFFDMVFIDADKENYLNYFKLVEPKLNARGVVVVDNVLWSGRVLLSEGELGQDTSSLAIKEFNQAIQERSDLYKTVLPIRDGLSLITKKTY